MTKRTRLGRCMLAGLVFAALAGSACARRQDYPARAVTIVIPFAPGGGTDLLARMLAQKLEQRLGKSFVVENKPAPARHRGGRGAEGGAGRPHADDGADADHGGQRLALQEAALRSGRRFRSARAGWRRRRSCWSSIRRCRSSRSPSSSPMPRRKPGKLSFASVGPGVPHHLYMRAAQEHDRHRDVARALQAAACRRSTT